LERIKFDDDASDGTGVDDVKKLIKSMAWTWKRRLPAESVTDTDDLEQEGWIVYVSCRQKHKPSSNVKFSTFLWRCLANRFNNIVRSERRYRVRITTSEEMILFRLDSQASQERMAIISEAIEVIRKVCPELADMVSDKVPDELLAIAKSRKRRNRMRRGLKSMGSNLTFDRWLLENYFGIKLDKDSAMRRSVYDIID